MALMTEKIRELFDKALELNEGEFITIPCATSSQCDSLRTMLHRERSRYRAASGLDDNLTVSKVRGTNNLRIMKVSDLLPATITRKNGSTELLIPETSKNDVITEEKGGEV